MRNPRRRDKVELHEIPHWPRRECHRAICSDDMTTLIKVRYRKTPRVNNLLNIGHHFIPPKWRKTHGRVILGWYYFSFYLVSITSEKLSEEFFLVFDSHLRRIPTIPQYGSSGLLYYSKTNICIRWFWQGFERILARHRECDDTFPTTRNCIYDGCGHGNTLRCFRRIHHWHSHSNRWLGRIASEYISSQLAESTIHRRPHISLDFYLCHDIVRIFSYLISISLLDECIFWFFDTPYREECACDPDDFVFIENMKENRIE